MLLKIIDLILILICFSTIFIVPYLLKIGKMKNIEKVAIITGLSITILQSYFQLKHSMIIGFSLSILWLCVFISSQTYFFLRKRNIIDSFWEFMNYKNWKGDYKKVMNEKIEIK